MSKRFRDCNLDQWLLLPPLLEDWLPEGHLARFVAEVAKALDLSAIYATYAEGDGRRLAAYDRRKMVRLLIYGYCRGVKSSRRMDRGTYEDVASRYLAAAEHPDHNTITDFRKGHLRHLGYLFVEVLRLCQRVGLVSLGQALLEVSNALRNFTDLDSRIMKDAATKAFVQAYNAQAGVDSHAQVIVTAVVRHETNDQRQLVPRLEQVKIVVWHPPQRVMADSSYFSEAAAAGPKLAASICW